MHIAKKTLSFILTVILIFTFAVFLSAPAKYAESITKGISLWAVSVLPATFPLLFLTSLITEQHIFRKCSAKMAPVTKKLFRISGMGGSIALLSVFSGYPVGARSLLNLYETSPYPRDEGFRLSCLASTSGPSFIVGVVGSMMFKSAKAGWLMFLSHLIAVFFVCFLLRFTARTQTETTSRVLKQNNGSLFDKMRRRADCYLFLFFRYADRYRSIFRCKRFRRARRLCRGSSSRTYGDDDGMRRAFRNKNSAFRCALLLFNHFRRSVRSVAAAILSVADRRKSRALYFRQIFTGNSCRHCMLCARKRFRILIRAQNAKPHAQTFRF